MSLIDEMLRDLEGRQGKEHTLVVSGLKISGRDPRVVIPKGNAKTKDRERTGWSSAEFTQIWPHHIPLAVNETQQESPMFSKELQQKFFSFFAKETSQQNKKSVEQENSEITQEPILEEIHLSPEKTSGDDTALLQPVTAKHMFEFSEDTTVLERLSSFRKIRFMLGVFLGLSIMAVSYQFYKEGTLQVHVPKNLKTMALKTWQKVAPYSERLSVKLLAVGEASVAYWNTMWEPTLQPITQVMQAESPVVAVVSSTVPAPTEAQSVALVTPEVNSVAESLPLVTPTSPTPAPLVEELPPAFHSIERFSDLRQQHTLEEIARLAAKEAEQWQEQRPDFSDPIISELPPSLSVKNSGSMRKQFRRDTVDISKVMQKVQGLEKIGRTDEAIGVLQNAIVRSPDILSIRERLAELYLDKERYFEAYELLEEGLLQSSQHLPFMKLAARALIALQRPEQAVELLSKQLPPVSEDPEVHAILGALYQRTGQHEMAMQTYWHLLDYFPESGRWWTGLAISLEATGELVGALDGYKHAIKDYNLKTSLRHFANERIQALSLAQ